MITFDKKTKRTFFWLVQMPIMCSFSIFIIILLTILGFITTFSFIGLKIENSTAKNFIKSTINSRLNDFKIDFQNITIDKTPIRNAKINLHINNVEFTHKKSKIEVAKFEELYFSIPVKQIITGTIIPAIGEINNKSFYIPLQNNKDLMQNDKKTFSKINGTFANDIQIFSTTFISLIDRTKLLLTNGVKMSNLNFNFIDENDKKEISKIKLIKSETLMKNKNQLSSNRVKLLEKLQENTEQRENLFIDLYNKIRQNNLENEQIITHLSTIEYKDTIFILDGVCLYDELKIAQCLFKIENLPTKIFDNIQQISANIDTNGTFNGYLFANFTNKGLSNIKVNAHIKPSNDNLGVYDRKIDDINLIIKADNNFKNIKQANLSFNEQNKEILQIEASNIISKNGIFTNGDVKFYVNNIKLTQFYSFFTQKIKKLNDKKLDNFDGHIDGTILFKLKNGKLVKIDENYSSIKIRNITYNSKKIEYNLSDLVFSLELDEEKLILKTTASNKNDDGNIKISLDTITKQVDIDFNDLIIDKSLFNQIKQTILTPMQYKITKRFNFATKINGNISIPLFGEFDKHGSFNIKINVLATDEDDYEDDEINLIFEKNKGDKKGIGKIDFTNSSMYSMLYDIHKNKNDIMYIDVIFDFEKTKNTFFKIDAKWFFNEKKVSDFYAYVGKGVHIGITSEKANLIVISEDQRKYYLKIFGDKIEIDHDFWHTILFTITMLKGNESLTLDIETKNGRIDDIFFQNAKLLIKAFGNLFFIVNAKFDMFYKDEKYFNTKIILDKNIIDIDVENIIPLLKLADITDLPMKRIALKANGLNDSEKKINKFENIEAKFSYEDIGLLDFTRLQKVKSKNLSISEYDITARDVYIFAEMANACVNLDLNFNGETKLEGRFRLLTPWRKIKKMFIEPNLTATTGGASILKKGKTFEEFEKHLEINGKDFSTKENGKQEISLNLIYEALSD